MKQGVSVRSLRRAVRGFLFSRSALLCLPLVLTLAPAALVQAQEGQGAIQGTVTDKTGALIPNAAISVTSTDTGVEIKRRSNKAGDYTVSPLQPGHYIVTAASPGFQTLVQENVTVDALTTLGLNLRLTIGSETQTVTITDAPPLLDTQDASLGGTIENELYTQLPLSMNGGPRDPTQFAFLMPGVQEGTSGPNGGGTGVFGGTGQENLNQTYINGMPVSTISAQGDPTTVRNAVSVDAVDQFQVKTNGAGVAFGGAGVTNFTIKSGGNAVHGTLFDYVRNTAFDTWGYFSKNAAANGYAVKPGEHQNSYGGTIQGPIIKDKLFYFGTYEGYHLTRISNTPQYLTVPTLRERQGDFTDAFGTGEANQTGVYGIFDPTSSGGGRTQFRGLLNGIPTFNVIPTSEISPISQYLAQKLPVPTTLSTVNNYLAGLPLQNDDYRVDARLDYTISPRHKVSIVGLGGNNGYNKIPRYSSQIQLPFPYAAGDFTSQKSATGIITYTFVASERLINTLNYGYTRTWGQGFAPTQGTKFTAAAAGINNLPSGNASSTFPGITFSGGSSTAEPSPSSWGSNAFTGPQATNNYTLIDNLLYVRGRHNFTFGIQLQWLETNAAAYGGPSGTTALLYNGYNTEDLNTQTGGSAYASFLVGAVYSGNVRTQSISDVGGRFHPIAPYVQDSWRVTPKITVQAGLRYDYLQPWHEGKNRFAFVNPDLANPVTGNKGVIQFGGYGKAANPLYSPYVCQCSTPVHPYNKNFEPSLSVAYSPNRTTVIRTNFAVITTHAGGTGGNRAATAGPGNNSEYAYTQVWQPSGSTSAPAFFLNPSLNGQALNGLYTPGSAGGQADFSSVPQFPYAGNLVDPLSTTGNYQIPNPPVFNCANQSAGYCVPSTQNFVDLYYGGRGPQFVNYNIGIEQTINKSAVLQINYAGSQTHFLPGGSGRGAATNSISPDYLKPLGALLGSTIGSPGVVDAVKALIPGYSLPYNAYQGPNATVAHSFSAFPQFGNLTDIWGATGNSSYNALQVSVIQRAWHNLSGFANYTWSKSVDDTGTHRTQYPVGPQDGNFDKNYSASGIDRGVGTFDQRHAFNATFNYLFPFGQGQRYLAHNKPLGLLAGGWSMSGILKLRQGTPIQVTQRGSCFTNQSAGQGTCMPDYTPGFLPKQARMNGEWGRAPGSNAGNVQTIQYLNPAAFQCAGNAYSITSASCNSFQLGNIARSAPDGLRGPGWKDLDLGFRRTFALYDRGERHITFQFEADVQNATNSTYFTLASGSAQWANNCAVGAINVQQCAGLAYGTVGGQNANVPPRDWQFAGRVRF